MTTQLAETLIHEGKTVSLFSNLLNDFFRQGGHDPGCESTSTAMWRGYLGTWEIVNGRQHLVELQDPLKFGDEASLESVFHGFPDRVFAHWDSGRLRRPHGKPLKYVHMGDGSRYERDAFLTLLNGVVVNPFMAHNGVAQEDAPNGYGIRVMTTWPSHQARASDGADK